MSVRDRWRDHLMNVPEEQLSRVFLYCAAWFNCIDDETMPTEGLLPVAKWIVDHGSTAELEAFFTSAMGRGWLDKPAWFSPSKPMRKRGQP